MLTGALAGALSDALGAKVTSAHPVAGGDVNIAYRVELADGGVVFAKTHPSPPPGFFTTEALGLDWLHQAGAVPVPATLAYSDPDPGPDDGSAPGFLAMEWIDEGPRHEGSDPELGHQLARLHQAGAPRFGREDRRTTSSRRLPNEPCATWTEFYATQRLEPLRRLATDAEALPPAVLAGIDQVVARIDTLTPPDEPPARLHGDLWAGNRMTDRDGHNWLIDPAAHGGHREFDLAMMHLFGGFGEPCFRIYDEVFPLSEGWTDRLPLHQLAPLVVHAIKFGGPYVAAAERALDQLR